MSEAGPGRPSGQVGPYRIERLLGAGGMGVVYLGYHQVTGEPAAVKLIRDEYAADPSFRARLRREIKAARRVPRFCTVPVLEADVDADPPWVATEYVDAPTLDVALLGARPFAGADLEAVAVAVAVALRAIHAHGVIHRDLKPSNVLMSPQGPRVIDFGIARPADPAGQFTRITHTGVALGTPAYMAPEQFTGGPITPAVDIYAWARLVCYAATGRAPTTAPGEEPDLDHLPAPLAGLVAAALARDPATRPTAAELVDRLTHDPDTPPATTAPSAAATDVAPPATPPSSPAVHAASALIPAPADRPPRRPPPRSTTRAAPAPNRQGSPLPATADRPPQPPPRMSLMAMRHRSRRVLVILTVLVLITALLCVSMNAVPSDPDGLSGSQADDPPDFERVYAVGVGELEEVPIAVTGEEDATVRVWDLTTGQQIGEPLTGHTD